jgi:diamine N-acetyltransferase
MLERRTVTRDHLLPLIDLAVRPDQRDQVSPNVKTFAQAPFEPGARVWGLWVGRVPVGLMAMVHPREYPYHVDGEDPEAAYLWRLMIDAAHQGRGYGRAAILMALEVAREWDCPRLSLGVSDDHPAAQGFYEGMGFRLTGHMVDGDRMMVRDVP